MAFCKEFNARTQAQDGTIPALEITISRTSPSLHHEDAPPAAILIKKELVLEKGLGVPNRNKVGKLTKAQVRQDCGAQASRSENRTLESAMAMVPARRARMGVEVER